MRIVVTSLVRAPVLLRVETDVVEQLQAFVRIGSRDVRRASVADDLAPVDYVLVALRMPPKSSWLSRTRTRASGIAFRK